MNWEPIIVSVCTFVTIWLLLYATIDNQMYYKCIYNDDVTVFVDNKNLFHVNVIYNTGERVKLSLFFFVHNFEII